jgi:DNA-binding MarR family transcriptional regulator
VAGSLVDGPAAIAAIRHGEDRNLRAPIWGKMVRRSAKKIPNAAPPAAPTLPKGSERILGLAVNTLGRCIVWSLAQRTAQHGVLPGAYPVIAWLMHLQEATQTELSRLIGIEQPTMAITLRRMERNGIIKRSPDPDHGRKSLVKLTARGRRLSDVISAAAHDVQKVAFKGLTTAELDEFYRLVGLMTENLSAERHG